MSDFGVVLGSSTGLVKGLNFTSKLPINICNLGAKSISTASWDVSPYNSESILLGTKDGYIVRHSMSNVADSTECNLEHGSIVNLIPCEQNILSVCSDGTIQYLAGGNLKSECEIKAPGPLSCGRTYESTVAAGGHNCNLHLWDLEKPELPVFSAKNVRPTTLQLEVPIWISDISFVPRQNGRIILTSSRIGELCLYDTRCGQRRPVSRHAWRMSRMHGKIKVGKCAHGAVLPDISVTRPVTKALAFGDAPGSGIRIVAGNAIGDLCFLDMRLPRERVVLSSEDESTSTTRVKSYGTRAAEPPLGVQNLSGASGSITGLACGGDGWTNLPTARLSAQFNQENIIVASSLDRYLRFYNRDTGERLAKLYTKVPISSFLIGDKFSSKCLKSFMSDSAEKSSDGEAGEQGEADGSESEESELDELWDLMEPVDDDEAQGDRSGHSQKNAKRRRRK